MSDHVGNPSPQQGAAVIDIDGVLADVRHRLHHIQGRPKDWAAFFAAVGDDPLLPEGAAMARQAASDGLEIVYLTGRPERLRADTAGWLRHWDLPDGRLVMRPDRDHRPARLFKIQALTALDRDVAWVLDDDPEVLDAVREAGFSTRHAAWAERSRTLHQAQEGPGESAEPPLSGWPGRT
ncbi:MAG: LNS2 domain-containing protein [Candidatus Nanopelagicales bacterium]